MEIVDEIMNPETRRFFMVAAKDISQNRRIPLLARYFADRGFEVHVFAYTQPHPIFNDNRVRFRTLNIKFFRASLLKWAEKTDGNSTGFWRARKSMGQPLSLIVGSVEWLKYQLRMPLSRLAYWTWGRSLPQSVGNILLKEHRYAHILRVTFGPFLADKRRERFNKKCRNEIASFDTGFRQNDVIFCHDRFSAELALSFLERSKPDVIFDVPELIHKRSNRSLERKSSHQLREIRHAEKLLEHATLMTVGESMVDELNQSGNMQVVLNGRPQSHYVGDLSSNTNRKLIAFSGAFFPGAGIEKLLETLSFLPNDYKLLLVGSFASTLYEIEIMQRLQTDGLASRVEYIPDADVENLPSKLSPAGLYVLPFSTQNRNLQVSMPNRLFDALAAGLPVLAQTGLSLTDWVEKNNVGCAIDFNSPKTAATAIIETSRSKQIQAWRHQIEPVFLETSYESQMQSLTSYLSISGITDQ